eukprot:965041-Rhodomonas_salina.2
MRRAGREPRTQRLFGAESRTQRLFGAESRTQRLFGAESRANPTDSSDFNRVSRGPRAPWAGLLAPGIARLAASRTGSQTDSATAARADVSAWRSEREAHRRCCGSGTTLHGQGLPAGEVLRRSEERRREEKSEREKKEKKSEQSEQVKGEEEEKRVETRAGGGGTLRTVRPSWRRQRDMCARGASSSAHDSPASRSYSCQGTAQHADDEGGQEERGGGGGRREGGERREEREGRRREEREGRREERGEREEGVEQDRCQVPTARDRQHLTDST